MLLFLGFLVKAIACTLRCRVGEPLKVFFFTQIKNRIHKAFVSKHLMYTLSNNAARKTVSCLKKKKKKVAKPQAVFFKENTYISQKIVLANKLEKLTCHSSSLC